jgi:hypothetical protein
MSGFLEGKQLKDPKGNGVIYANHAYDNKGESVFTWIAKMEEAAKELPIIISEFGGSGGPNRRRGWWGQSPSTAIGDDWLLHVLQAIQDHNWSFTAWDLHPSAGPVLIADWNYMPTEDFGVYVKKLLAEGKLPKYTPPDLTKIAQEQVSPLPESARMGGKEIYGDWELEPTPGERQGSILFFMGDDEEKLAGYWINFRGLNELKDVRFKDNAVSFTQTARFEKEEYKALFRGKIEDDKLTGVFEHGGIQDKINAKRVKETPSTGGNELTGIWMLDVTGERGTTRQRLKVNPDLSGLYGTAPIEKINLDGDKASFKMEFQWGPRRFEMNFEGKLDGKKLTGELKTQRGEQKVTGNKISH